MIQVNNLEKAYSDQVLFQDVTFNLNPGERIGLVGRNGGGKSTLFKIITGEIEADSGTVSIPKNYSIGTLSQHIVFKENSVLEECIKALPIEYEFEHFRAEKLLSGLGFSEKDFHKDPYSFSGGYQIRINLVKALLKSPNLLLLDEPTNYLDILSIQWLKDFLRKYPGEVMLITHDRSFMDDVVTHTMGIHRESIKKIKGNTTKFYHKMKEEDEIYEQTKENLDKKRKELQSFIDRFGAKASKASQAQSKLKQLEKLGEMESLAHSQNVNLNFEYQDCPGKVLIEAKDLSFSYSGKAEDELFSKLSFNVTKNDRIAIIGKNGKGKSTLLNVLGDILKPTQGSLKEHPSCLKSLYGQTNIERLHSSHTIVNEITSANPKLSHTKIRQICGAMMFSGELADKKINVLSGGEKSRVMLGKILAKPANLLLLDEPTNHLDMETIEILSEKLQTYKGAIILVSHDERLLRKLAKKLIIFHKNTCESFLGTYNDFIEKIGWEEVQVTGKSQVKSKLNYKELKAKRAEIVKERSKELKPLKTKVEELENLIHKSENEIKELNRSLILASEKQDGKLINELSQKISNLNQSIEESFDELELFSEDLQRKETYFNKILDELEK
jgi:ATP-binding cassette subfamily F protein 3